MLERNYQAFQFLKKALALSDLSELNRALAPLLYTVHSVNHINNQFAQKIIPCFLNPNVDEALASFRKVVPHTTDEELLTLINESHFKKIHKDLHTHLVGLEEEIKKTVHERLSPTGIITTNDDIQFSGAETTRSLEHMLANGLEISFEQSKLEKITAAYTETNIGIIPLIELLKNDRIIAVNGLRDSKISLAVHDAIDHTWTFSLAKRVGLFEKYKVLFNSIGNPELTDIFKREGEAVASIGFGVRYWATMEHGFVPKISTNDLLKSMDGYFNAGQLEERHYAAYRILRELDTYPTSREAQSLGFVFSNYIVELDEQRRKHGKIWQRDLTGTLTELDPFSPDYLCFFIELHHAMLSSKNKHRNEILRFHILLEDFFYGLGSGKISPESKLTVRIQDMPMVDFSKTSLPPKRINWMTRNYGFLAIRDAMV